MTIPHHDQGNSVFTAKNFAIISMAIAFVYLSIIVIQICTKKKSDRESELSEEFVSKGSLSYTYYYDEEYTNS